MPINPQNFSPVGSASSSLRSEPFLSPPVSHSSLDDIPFKAQENDRVSLSLKKAKGRRHGQRPGFSHRQFHSEKLKTLRNKAQKCGSGHGPSQRSLRTARSLPLIQPRFGPGIVELLPSPKRQTRRWTVPSKAGSTRGLATIVPVQTPASIADDHSSQRVKMSQSPAMITLRRATTSESHRRASFTSFPTPKFSRGSSGFLSSFLNSITGQDGPPPNANTKPGPASRTAHASRSASVISNGEVLVSTTAAAPPVQTEVVQVEPRLSLCNSNHEANPFRRCSTRYISDNAVYEIIWDENWSSTSSEGASSSPQGKSLAMDGRCPVSTDALGRRLSMILNQSSRKSIPVVTGRKMSCAQGSTSKRILEGLSESPSLAKMFRDPGFGIPLPRSRASRKAETLRPMAVQVEFEQSTLADPPPLDVGTAAVEFFPPLRSRANTNGSTASADKPPDPHQESLEAVEQMDEATVGSLEDAPGRQQGRRGYGSMVGISSRAKRPIVSPDEEQEAGIVKGTRTSRRVASINRRAGQDSSDDTVPLLAPSS